MPADPLMRDKMRAALDHAFTDAMGALFKNLRVNEFGERTEDAEKQFAVGVARLIDDYQHALAAVDAACAG